MLFMRSTNDAEKDLKGGYSYHQSDFKAGTIDWLEDGETEKQWVAKRFGCDEEEIEIAEDGYYVQALEGLCAYALEAETLEEAIEEISEMDIEHMESINPENIYIFEGKEVYSSFIIEGTLMNATKLLGKYVVAEIEEN